MVVSQLLDSVSGGRGGRPIEYLIPQLKPEADSHGG